jgi:limonene-1,2-epoxide hydrolase
MANVAVVQAFITAFGSGDAETALGHLHDDVQVTEPVSLPIGGEYAGKAAFVGFLAEVAATYDVKIHRAKAMGATWRWSASTSPGRRTPPAPA